MDHTRPPINQLFHPWSLPQRSLVSNLYQICHHPDCVPQNVPDWHVQMLPRAILQYERNPSHELSFTDIEWRLGFSLDHIPSLRVPRSVLSLVLTNRISACRMLQSSFLRSSIKTAGKSFRSFLEFAKQFAKVIIGLYFLMSICWYNVFF